MICDQLCDNIESLFDIFNLEYKLNNKMYTMSCPIHGGDNPSALNIYHTGDNYRGNWVCRTHGCEKIFKPSIIGFIRGILSVERYDWQVGQTTLCPFNEAVQFALSFLKQSLKDFKVSKVSQEKTRFTQIVQKITNQIDNSTTKLNRSYVLSSLKIPATYYIDRGYSIDILKKYDVGLCDTPGKEMENRVVAPIYTDDHRFVVGCTGRSIHEKCQTCGSYHDTQIGCPKSEDLWKYSKWKHNFGFKSQNYLYNFWYAKQHILESSTAILVESPGNVWRLEENGIHNSLAMFGCVLSDRQKIILDSSGAMNIIVLTDNDEAGRQAAMQIKAKCAKTYKIYIPQIHKPDVGEMTPEEIQKEIKDFMVNI